MSKTSLVPLSREQFNLLLSPDQFNLLREAKRKISDEFGKELGLHSKDVLNEVHHFSKESKDERLLEIFNTLQQHIGIGLKQVTSVDKVISDKVNLPTPPKTNKLSVGDIVDGKVCTGFYRGQPVFKNN